MKESMGEIQDTLGKEEWFEEVKFDQILKGLGVTLTKI